MDAEFLPPKLQVRCNFKFCCCPLLPSPVCTFFYEIHKFSAISYYFNSFIYFCASNRRKVMHSRWSYLHTLSQRSFLNPFYKMVSVFSVVEKFISWRYLSAWISYQHQLNLAMYWLNERFAFWKRNAICYCCHRRWCAEEYLSGELVLCRSW